MSKCEIDAKLIISLFALVFRNKENTKIYVKSQSQSRFMVFDLSEDCVIKHSPNGYNKHFNGYKIKNIEDIDVSSQIKIKDLAIETTKDA